MNGYLLLLFKADFLWLFVGRGAFSLFFDEVIYGLRGSGFLFLGRLFFLRRFLGRLEAALDEFSDMDADETEEKE